MRNIQCAARLCAVLALFFFVSAPQLKAFAETAEFAKAFSIQVPDNWDSADQDIAGTVPKAVASLLNCVDDTPSELLRVGWKLDASGKVLGAYCISYQRKGMGRVRSLLKTSTGEQREEIAAMVVDNFAGKIHKGYEEKRNMRVKDMSGELIEAGEDAILVIDAKITGDSARFMRSGTAFLHGEACLSVDAVYDPAAPAPLLKELEDMPMSVQWKP